MDVQWGWLGVLVGAVIAVSALFSFLFDVPLLAVLKPFGAMAFIGLVIGWMLRHIAHFNPYEY